VNPNNGFNQIFSGYNNGLQSLSVDNNGIGAGIINYTLSNITASDLNLWQFDGFYDVAGSGVASILAHPGQNIDQTDAIINTPVLIGDINGTSEEVRFTTVQHAYYGTLDTTGSDTVIVPLQNFTIQELRGRDIFAANCTKCHSPVRSFQEVFEACNGLDINYSDNGKGILTSKASDMGVFKSPSLRNITLSAPYMHDGRFATLEDVIDFYSDGIKPHPNLHPLLIQPNGSTKMDFTAEQKKDLLAFLKTMTASDIAYDIIFTDPFRY
jgi:hypothetical protein